MVPGVDLIISTLCNTTLGGALYSMTKPNFTSEVGLQLYMEKNALQRTFHILAKEINGKHLKIGTYNNKPMSTASPDIKTGQLTGRGVAFYLLEILQEKFNFTYEIVLPKKNIVMGGSNPDDSLIGLVSTGKVDMGAAFVANILEFRKLVSFSTPIDEETWVMMLRRPKESAVGEGLFAPFADHVWFFIMAAVISFGPCITILTHIRAKLMPDDEPPISLKRSVWFVYGVYINQGTNLAPKANMTRLLMTTWWLFILLVSAFYSANLTAFVTLSEFTLEIERPRDLVKKNSHWVATKGSAVEYVVTSPTGNMFYLNEMVKRRRAEFESYAGISDFYPQVDKGAVLITSSTSVVNAMYRDYLEKTKQGVPEAKRCKYVISPNPFMRNQRGFIYPKNSTLKTLFDRVLGIIVQSGIVYKLKTIKLPYTTICPLDLQSKERKLQNTDLVLTYELTAFGVCVAIGVFIGEVVMKRCNLLNVKRESETKKVKSTKCIKNTTVHCLGSNDDSQPPLYDTIFGKASKIRLSKNTYKKIVNGREYLVVDTKRGIRLIPIRAPSALLYRVENI